MRLFYSVIRRELFHLRRERLIVFLLVVQPLLFMLVVGWGISVGKGTADPKLVLIAESDASPLHRAFSDAMKQSGLYRIVDEHGGVSITEQEARREVEDGAFAAVLVPGDPSKAATSVVLPGGGDEVAIAYFVEHTRAVLAQVRLELELAPDRRPVGTGELLVETVTPGSRSADPYESRLPGFAVFGILWIVNIASVSILQDRESGAFARMLVSRLTATHIVVGKLLTYVVVSMAQLSLMFAVGHVVFDLRFGSSPVAFYWIAAALGFAVTGIALWLASFAKSVSHGAALATLFIITTSAVGGAFIPVDSMPTALAVIARVTVQYWAISGLQDVIVQDASFRDVAMQGLVLSLVGAIATMGAVRRLQMLEM